MHVGKIGHSLAVGLSGDDGIQQCKDQSARSEFDCCELNSGICATWVFEATMGCNNVWTNLHDLNLIVVSCIRVFVQLGTTICVGQSARQA